MNSPNSILSQLASGLTFNSNDSFIAVMGVTGAGKSTFISRCAGGGAKIGHGLVSCTSDVETYSFKYNDRTVHLIDTPGFDDTYRTDSDVLKDIAFWLNTAYRQHIVLSGIVYLHPINRNRITGASYKNLRMFQKLCGDKSLPSVVLATTMWEDVKEADGEMRVEELKTRPEFWGNMVSQGSRVFRHEDSRASAMNIVSYILDQRKQTVLQIQRQMVDEGKTLDETEAGQEVEKELIKQRELFERRLKEAQEEMQIALKEGNKRAIEEAAEQQERFQKKLTEAFKGSEELKVTMQKLLEQKDREYQKALEDLEVMKERSADESKQVTLQMEVLKKQISKRDEDADEERRKYLKEMDEMNMRVSKQSMESQLSLHKWMIEQEKTSNYALSIAPSESMQVVSGSREIFKSSFSQSAGTSMGQAAGVATVSALLIPALAGGCVVM